MDLLGTLLIVALAAPAQEPPVREVVATVGPVTLLRSDRLFRLVPRSALGAGDQVNSGPGGGTLYLDGKGRTIQLGPGAAALLDADEATTRLMNGEVRAVSEGAPVKIASGLGEARFERGIVRVSAGEDGARIWVEEGSAEVIAGDGKAVALAQNQEVRIGPDGHAGAPGAGQAGGWTIDVEGFQLASAAESSRRRKRILADEQTDMVANEFQPGPQDPNQPATDPAATDDATQGGQQADANGDPNASSSDAGSRTSVTQLVSTSAISLALGSASASQGAGSSGGLFSDAQQDSLTNGFSPLGFPLAGNIHLVTARTRYPLSDVRLTPADAFPVTREYWSIGLGKSPASQVVTTFRTGSDPIPQTIRVPRTDAYLIRFPQSNFGIPDPASNPVAGTFAGISGLVGAVPTAPQATNATPLTDGRAVFNDRATFALGDFALDRNARDKPVFEIRRSDQDRQIIKSPTGNDNNDQVTLNPKVDFVATQDFKFFPELKQVSQPRANNPLNGKPSYANIDPVRKAAATTLLADRLNDYSRRTGRTRFVLDGKVVDISGYRPSNPLLNANRTVGPQGVGGGGGANRAAAPHRR